MLEKLYNLNVSDHLHEEERILWRAQRQQKKIIQAAIELVKEKGYTAATTKEIAMRAGVNEVTIFRNFKSKKGVIEAAVAEFSYVPHLKQFLQTEIVWELETDLKKFSKALS